MDNIILSSQDYSNDYDFVEDLEFLRRWNCEQDASNEYYLKMLANRFNTALEKGRVLKNCFLKDIKELKALYFMLVNGNINKQDIFIKKMQDRIILDYVSIKNKNFKAFDAQMGGKLTELLNMLNIA